MQHSLYKIITMNEECANKGREIFLDNDFQCVQIGSALVIRQVVKSRPYLFESLQVKTGGYTDYVTDYDKSKFFERYE